MSTNMATSESKKLLELDSRLNNLLNQQKLANSSLAKINWTIAWQIQ